jgi:hypothetical protein
MKEKNMFLLSGFSGAVGGCLGAVSGSSSLFVVGVVGASMALVVTWAVSGFFS